MAFHPEQIEAELRGRGVGAEEAHFAVMRQFGNSPRIKEPQPRRDALLAGDRDVGRAFFSAADGAKSRFCRDGDAGARNRREYDDLRICGRGAGPALAVRAPNRVVDVAKSETGIPAIEYLAVANSIFTSILNLSSKNGGERGPKLTIRRNQRILRVGLTCSLLDISLFFLTFF